MQLIFNNLPNVFESFTINQILNCTQTSQSCRSMWPKTSREGNARRKTRDNVCHYLRKRYVCTAFFYFPQKKPHNRLNGAPPDAKAAAHPSGWMTGTNFLQYLKLQAYILVKIKKLLLILDNHECHTDVRVLQYCKDNEIILLYHHIVAINYNHGRMDDEPPWRSL